MDIMKDTSKSAPRPLPDYIPTAIAEKLMRDMDEYADLPEFLVVLQRLAFHPEMRGIYLKLGQRLPTHDYWLSFYASMTEGFLVSEFFKNIKDSRAEFERRKRRTVSGLRELISGLEWIVNPPDESVPHGFNINFRESMDSMLYRAFVAELKSGIEPPKSLDIDPINFLETCRRVLTILENPDRQTDNYEEQNNGTAKRAVFVRAIAKCLQLLESHNPKHMRILSADDIALLTRVVFNQTEPNRDGGYLFTREHVREALKNSAD